jgi:hypothetical protein
MTAAMAMTMIRPVKELIVPSFVVVLEPNGNSIITNHHYARALVRHIRVISANNKRFIHADHRVAAQKYVVAH